MRSRDVFDLGTDPTQYIIYPGGKGYYFDEVLEETLRERGINPTQDELDSIFWDFLDPEIQRVIQGFEKKTKKSLSGPDTVVQDFHLFDRRRIHFLRFGSMDQQDIHRMPDKFFRALSAKSRDEIEQYFMREERIIRPRELIRYLFVIFGLQHHLLYSRPDQTGWQPNRSRWTPCLWNPSVPWTRTTPSGPACPEPVICRDISADTSFSISTMAVQNAPLFRDTCTSL